MTSVPPTRMNSRSCNTRSSLTWVETDISLTSSKNSVPVPLALASWPGVALAALAFMPCEVARARFEQRYLRATFGPAYEAYAARTGAFLFRHAARDESKVEGDACGAVTDGSQHVCELHVQRAVRRTGQLLGS